MTTTMISKGSVEFKGLTIELGKPVLVDGRKGTPFLAWVRDGLTPDRIVTIPHTTVRIKWDHTYMPSDFSDVYGKQVTIEAAL